MARIRPLRIAPIIEALFDLRVVLPTEVGPDAIKALHARIAVDYPEALEQRRWQSKIDVKDGVPHQAHSTDLGVVGYMCKSVDGKRVVQLRLDGFSFSRLAPYTSWEDCRDAARPLWEIYTSLGVSRVTRVGARFINVLDVPMPTEGGFESYFTSLPPAPGADLNLNAFMNQMQLTDPKAGFSAIVTQALRPPRNPTVATLMLDIDTFREAAFEPPFETAWQTLSDLRNFKNQLFFNAITEKTSALFD